MKIRQGFVSNSSSSSFVAVIDKTSLTVLRKSLNKFEKKLLDSMKKGKRKLHLGEYILLADYLCTEEPEQQRILEEFYKDMDKEDFKTMLNIKLDWANVEDYYVRTEIVLEAVQNIREKIRKLQRQQKAITHLLEM